eukprot:m.12956 g.12956  ORF g.12956 m.12956 type:complete len:263 (-) comp5882_c0_seq1:253-1041(-)
MDKEQQPMPPSAFGPGGAAYDGQPGQGYGSYQTSSYPSAMHAAHSQQVQPPAQPQDGQQGQYDANGPAAKKGKYGRVKGSQNFRSDDVLRLLTLAAARHLYPTTAKEWEDLAQHYNEVTRIINPSRIATRTGEGLLKALKKKFRMDTKKETDATKEWWVPLNQFFVKIQAIAGPDALNVEFPETQPAGEGMGANKGIELHVPDPPPAAMAEAEEGGDQQHNPMMRMVESFLKTLDQRDIQRAKELQVWQEKITQMVARSPPQ